VNKEADVERMIAAAVTCDSTSRTTTHSNIARTIITQRPFDTRSSPTDTHCTIITLVT
jgi:hypothetical protein